MHPHSRVSLHCSHEETCILCLLKCVQWRFWSDCANAQADLNLRWAHMSTGTFSDVAAQMSFTVCSRKKWLISWHSPPTINTKRNCIPVTCFGMCVSFNLKQELMTIHWYELRRQKTYLRTCAPCEDSDQPVRSCSLIGTSLGAFWIANDSQFLRANNGDSDPTLRRRRLIRFLFGRICQKFLAKECAKYITKTCLCNFDPLKPHFYIVKTGVYRDIHYFSYFCSRT